MITETGFCDRHGIPILVDDLIRVPHYLHRRNRRQMWLYFRVVVVEGVPCVREWHRTEGHQCRLADTANCEVLAHAGTERHADGTLRTFNERKTRTRKGPKR